MTRIIMTQSFIQTIILTLVLLHRSSEVSASTVYIEVPHSTVAHDFVTTEAPVEGPVRILTITAKSYISELYVDNTKVLLSNDNRWNETDDVVLHHEDRLISVAVTDTSFTCAGILASVTDDFFFTDARWKCTAQTSPGWYAIGFNDSNWSNARVIGKNGQAMTPGQCNILKKIPTISSNASWIWTASIANAPVYDQIVFCRGYLPFCDNHNPCLNGGTCNRNVPELCTCPFGVTGKYCEIANPLNTAALVGQTVNLKCQRTNSQISWWFTRPGFTTPTLIVDDCTVLDNFNYLYAIDKTDGACNLFISNVGIRHAGTYTCEDTTSAENRTSAQLTVLNGVQQCWFSPSLVVYGQTVTFTCQLAYSGNWAPAIRWKDLYGQTVTNATTEITDSSVTSTILIPSYFPTVPSFTNIVFFDASSLPDVTDDIEADNTPTNIYNDATPEIDVVCPSGFTRTSKYHCYMLIFEELSWNDSMTRCQQSYPGAYLVVITDSTEQTDVNSFLSPYGPIGHFWTSGFARNGGCSTTAFTWCPLSVYSITMSYKNWQSGEPDCDDAGYQNAMQLLNPGSQWADESITTSQYSLCEFELSPK